MEGYLVEVGLQACRLTLSDLAGLLKVIGQGFPRAGSPADLEIRSYLPGITAQAHSLEDFVAIEGLPDRFSRMEIRRVSRDVAGGIDQSVELTFLPYLNQLRITGRDELWVLGKRKEITDFLRTRRAWFWPLAGRWVWAGIPLSLAGPFALQEARQSGDLLAWALVLMLIAYVFAVALDYTDMLMPYAEIVVNSGRPRLGWRHLAAQQRHSQG